MKVALQGSYFGHNFGDILLLSMYTRWIREALERCQVVLPQASPTAVSDVGADSAGFLELLRSRALIYAGGGYFGEPPGSTSEILRWSLRNLYRHTLSGVAMSFLRRPIAIVGVGAGPLSYAPFRRILKRLVERAEVVAVRDEESRDFLRSIGVSRSDLEVTADAALSISMKDIPASYLAEVRKRFPDAEKSLIGLHVPVGTAFCGPLQQVLLELGNVMAKHRGLEVVIISDNPARDPMRYAQTLSQSFKNRIHLAPYRDYWGLVALLSQLRFVITTKLHVGIVAAAVGTLPLAFPYHPKTVRFYKQIGESDLCVPIIEVDRVRVAEQIDIALSRTMEPNRKYELPVRVRQAARRNKELVQGFVAELAMNYD